MLTLPVAAMLGLFLTLATRCISREEAYETVEWLTQPMSNQVAAIVVLPVAISTALQSNLDPRTFAMMVAVAASTSYLTLLEPSCVLV